MPTRPCPPSIRMCRAAQVIKSQVASHKSSYQVAVICDQSVYRI